MEKILFYKPDGSPKYANKICLWAVAELIDVADKDKNRSKWLRPLWASAADCKGIVIYVSRMEAEICVQHMNAYEKKEKWKVYPLDDFNIHEMMVSCKEATKSDKYHFLFSFGFWVNHEEKLHKKNGWISQAFFVNTFHCSEAIEEDEYVIVDFGDNFINSIYNIWNDKLPFPPKYEKYLESLNKRDEKYFKLQANIALENIEKTDDAVTALDAAAIWSPLNAQWIFTKPNE